VPASRSIANSSLAIAPSLGQVVSTGESASTARLELLTGLDVAVGGVADDPLRAAFLGLLVDQGPGVLAVVLVARRDADEVRMGSSAAAAAWSL